MSKQESKHEAVTDILDDLYQLREKALYGSDDEWNQCDPQPEGAERDAYVAEINRYIKIATTQRRKLYLAIEKKAQTKS